MRRKTPESVAAGEFEATSRDLTPHSYYWYRWCEWCAANGERPLPASWKIVRRFLHSQSGAWSEPTMRQAADAIAEAHLRLGYPDPTAGRVRTYLASVKRGLPGGELVKVDAVRLDDALTMAATRQPARPFTHRRTAQVRLTLRAGHRHQLDLRALSHATITIDGDTVILRLRDGTHVAMDETEPGVSDAARTVIETGEPTLGSATELYTSLQGTARRAHLRCPVTPHIAAGLDDDDVDWLDLWADPSFLQDLRDKTLVVVGVALARRAVELGRFEVDDFAAAIDGYDVTIHRSKTDRDGRGIDHYLPHLAPDQEHPWCPACAIAVWLHVLERRHGRPWTGPLFPSRVGGAGEPSGRMTTPLVARIVKRLWIRANGDPDARIGSRSLRIGGATTGREAGLSVTEIADSITKHRCLDACSVYIRTGNDQFHLPI